MVHSGAELSVLLRVKTKVSRWIRLYVFGTRIIRKESIKGFGVQCD